VLARYEIRIACRLDHEVELAFEGLDVAADGDLTVVTGELDQAALHGLLERVRIMGFDLVEVRRMGGGATWSPDDSPPSGPQLTTGG
jgi:hypothetical protein